jgi:hypothetical protein
MFIIGNGGKTTDHLIITDVKKGSVPQPVLDG